MDISPRLKLPHGCVSDATGRSGAGWDVCVINKPRSTRCRTVMPLSPTSTATWRIRKLTARWASLPTARDEAWAKTTAYSVSVCWVTARHWGDLACYANRPASCWNFRADWCAALKMPDVNLACCSGTIPVDDTALSLLPQRIRLGRWRARRSLACCLRQWPVLAGCFPCRQPHPRIWREVRALRDAGAVSELGTAPRCVAAAGLLAGTNNWRGVDDISLLSGVAGRCACVRWRGGIAWRGGTACLPLRWRARGREPILRSRFATNRCDR